ncbi:MAG: hypothetical protein IJM50_04565 [Lachnospiraceae bacterium]|nr:hypothetical protein [Lachnospiraceae bacterium]
MDLLKQLWPTPFKITPKDLKSFLVQLIIFIIVIVIASLLIGLLAKIPILGIVFKILGGLIDIYATVGVVLCILKFLDVLK